MLPDLRGLNPRWRICTARHAPDAPPERSPGSADTIYDEPGALLISAKTPSIYAPRFFVAWLAKAKAGPRLLHILDIAARRNRSGGTDDRSAVLARSDSVAAVVHDMSRC